MKARAWKPILCVALPAIFGATACVIGNNNVPAGELRTESKTVQLGAAKTVEVHIKMGAGELKVDGGATDLLNADFTYNVPRWKPEVQYNVTGDTGRLSIEQPSGGGHMGNTRYEWDLHLSNHVPMEMSVEEGAGRANLNLVGLALSNLKMDLGAGETTIDLDGPWKNNLDATVHGGVGKTTLHLPRDVGVRVEAHSGIGAINASGGFIKAGDAFTNSAYGTSPVTLRIDVKGGIGEIDLELGGASGTV
ncbi:MAG TPA: toast rack family protein [Terriglobia bacterium]|nr:toast rack family protein [Terriglobia bacterium]